MNYKEIHPKIFKISLPFPGKRPGPVNVYLVLGEKITLIDTGIIRTIGALNNVLGEIGIKFTDIDQIVITHGHIDHYGAAKRIVDESNGNAIVAAHKEDIQLIETGRDFPNKVGEKFLKFMGVPLLYREAMRMLRSGFRLFVDNCKVNMVLNDQDIIQAGDYKIKVIETPGHSKGAVCLFLEDENILFAGDHILEHITPNALVMLDSERTMPLRMSQLEFQNSLNKLEDLGSPVVYTGHGKEVNDLKKVITFYKEQFECRQKKILTALDSENNTIYNLTRHIFPEIKGLYTILNLYLAISEVYTHLQVLENEERVRSKQLNDKLIFKKV